MSMTNFATDNDLTRKVWSEALEVEAEVKSYFRKFTGTSPDSVIRAQSELTKKSGDKITVGLRMRLAGAGGEGDTPIEGTDVEEALNFYSDSVLIDQIRKGTKSKGKMSEQRVPYNLRKEGMDALSTWFAEWLDQQIFMYLSGLRGTNSFYVPTSWTGRAGNTLTTPDSSHLICGGNATSYADCGTDDTMSRTLFEKLGVIAEVVDPMIQPIMVEGEKKYVCVMHPFQAYDLRTSTSTNDWVDLHKNMDQTKSPIYSGSLGELNGIVMHSHRNVIKPSSTTARALFLGAQAGMIAYGRGGSDGNYSWHEESDDRGNALSITAGTIVGIKKTRFNSKDFGVIAVDTYATAVVS